jgi:hypothetical protein
VNTVWDNESFDTDNSHTFSPELEVSVRAVSTPEASNLQHENYMYPEIISCRSLLRNTPGTHTFAADSDHKIIV